MNDIHNILKRVILCFIAIFSSIYICAQDSTKVKSVTNSEFEKLIQSENVIILDVRNPKEFNEGHIPNALNIDYRSDDFLKNIKELNKNKTIAVYCRSGGRSKLAAKKLIDSGFNVFELNKGIMNWSGEISK